MHLCATLIAFTRHKITVQSNSLQLLLNEVRVNISQQVGIPNATSLSVFAVSLYFCMHVFHAGSS